MIKFGIHIDTTNFDKKPKDQATIGGIRNRIDSNHCKDSYTPMCDIVTLSKAIQNGYTFMPCHVAKMPEDAPEKYRFYSQQVIFIDIDNSDGRGRNSKPLPETEYFTLDKIQATLRNHGITPTIIYHSFSSKPNFEKFRVVIVLDEPITDRDERDKAVNALYQLFGNAADSSCRSIEKLFFGSYPNSVIVCDETAITTKGTLLQLYDKLFKPELDAQATLDGNQSEITAAKPLNSFSLVATAHTHTGGIDKAISPDFDPNALLDMIDPCKLSYEEWITVSASYKLFETGTQSIDFWLNWCSPYPDDDRKADITTWNGLTGEGITKGSLLKFAKLHSPTKFQDYVETMNPYSPKYRASSAKSNTDNQSEGNSQSEIPSYFTQHVNSKGETSLKVHCARLSQYIQKNDFYFFVQGSAFEGIRRYWYDSDRGVYVLTTDDILKSYVKNYITKFFPDIVKYRDITETFNLLTTDHERTLKEDALNSNEMIINFRNGLFDLRTMKLYKHSPEYKSTIQIDADFHPIDGDMNELTAKAPIFTKYLYDFASGDEQRMQFFLELIGACLSNVSGYRFKKVPCLVGGGDSGKSLFIRLIRELIGAENCASVEFSKLDERFQTSAIYGKRLAYDADVNYSAVGSNSVMMKASGGDAISFEVKGQTPYSAVYHGFLLVASNDFPRFKGNLTQAAYNRLITIPCTPVPKEKQDTTLLEKMLAERNVIIQLALTAFSETLKNGYRFTIPDICSDTSKDVKLNNDPVARFYEECCVFEQNVNPHFRKCSSIHAIYKEWYRENISDYGKASGIEFFARLTEHLGLSPEEAKKYKQSDKKLGLLYPFTLKDDIWNTYREGTIQEKHTS